MYHDIHCHITISELLTKTRHQVFMQARKLFGMQSCWSAEGKIKPDKGCRKITSMSEPSLAQVPSIASPVDDLLQASAGALPKATSPMAKEKAVRKVRR